MIIRIFGHDFHYETENLCRVFFPNEKINIVYNYDGDDDRVLETYCDRDNLNSRVEIKVKIDGKCSQAHACIKANADELRDKSELKMAQLIFNALSEITGYVPDWGVLTGVRPSKLMMKLIGLHGEEEAKKYFTESLLVSGEKTELARDVALAEEKIVSLTKPNSASLYVSIPFCPTRCSYCSFVSHSISNSNAKKLLPEYIDKLCDEAKQTGEIFKELGLRLESVYFGGGTPGVLKATELDRLLTQVENSFDLSRLREYTVEIGRPDTVTPDKLRVLRLHNVGRISINPQTFNQQTLDLIGRKHSAEQSLKAYRLARTYDFESINMDLIAGLPGESADDFKMSLDTTLMLAPENITVHTLALKRSSELNAAGAKISDGNIAKEMLEYAYSRLTKAGYFPYYMYRQSKCIGNLENVGWCKSGKECLYNVFMMEECHSVIALGAGGVTKLREPNGDRIERIFNYKYPYEYISGFDKITERKNGIKDIYLSYR